jgi:hypothetical protein
MIVDHDTAASFYTQFAMGLPDGKEGNQISEIIRTTTDSGGCGRDQQFVRLAAVVSR